MIYLLLAFALKHALGDVFLRNDYINRGKYEEEGWLKPLLFHAGIHGFLTWLLVAIYIIWKYNYIVQQGYPPIGLIFTGLVIGCAYGLFDFTAHAMIDRAKTVLSRDDMCPFDIKDLTVLDQIAHAATYVALIISLI